MATAPTLPAAPKPGPVPRPVAVPALEAKLGAPSSAGFTWRAQNMVAVKDGVAENLIKLVETLDDHDDVQNVYGNYELSEAAMAKLSG